MEIFTSNQAKNRFGELMMKSQKEPVQITRSGKPIVMVVSIEEYNFMEKLKLRYVREHLKESLADTENGNFKNGDTFFSDLMAGKYDLT